jgi:glycosyltransferase involved in cell wall biosynthesis
MNRLSISVVIPTFNARDTVLRALQSVIEQTHLPSEIIIVDDASNDGTWAEINRFAEQYREYTVKTIRLQQNVGPAEARNAGWNIADNKYIAFLDADDSWHPRKLELQYRWMRQHPDVVISGHRCEVKATSGIEKVEVDVLDSVTRMFGLRDFLLANRFSTPTVMLKTALPYRFAKGMRYCEDYQLWLQIVASHAPVAWFDMPLAYLFKAKYGVSGLSSNLWKMEQGELAALTGLRRARNIGLMTWSAACTWSLSKFSHRLMRSGLSGRSS